MTTLEKLNSIFCTVFDDEDIITTSATTANDVDGWDSLSHVNLIVAVEMGFGVRFSHKELLKQRNVGDLVTDIERKLAEKD